METRQLLWGAGYKNVLLEEVSRLFTLVHLSPLWEGWGGSAKSTYLLSTTVFMSLWISLIFWACLLDSLYYQEFKRISKEIREEKTSDSRRKYFCYSSYCYVWPAKLNTKMEPGRSEVLFCTSGFWFRRDNGNPLSQIHNSNAIQQRIKTSFL